jgi:nitroimidazol reductase NimA-like FMN-containing flavoprotein (pyridoxamine 5'-phosphate oxidase superfamily)
MSNLMTEPRFHESGMDAPEVRAALETILRDRRSGVLATSLGDVPLCSQMAFAASEDLRSLIVVTPRSTTKYDNMAANPNVSFLVSTVRNAPSDSGEATALTVAASARELAEAEREHAATIFTRKHPELAEFAAAPGSAVMALRVESFTLVDNFQRVTRIVPG